MLHWQKQAIKLVTCNFLLALRHRNGSVAGDVDWHTAECGWDSDWRNRWTRKAQAVIGCPGIVVQSRYRSVHGLLRLAPDLEQPRRLILAGRQAIDYCGGRPDARQDHRTPFAYSKRLEPSGSKSKRTYYGSEY